VIADLDLCREGASSQSRVFYSEGHVTLLVDQILEFFGEFAVAHAAAEHYVVLLVLECDESILRQTAFGASSVEMLVQFGIVFDVVVFKQPHRQHVDA